MVFTPRTFRHISHICSGLLPACVVEGRPVKLRQGRRGFVSRETRKKHQDTTRIIGPKPMPATSTMTPTTMTTSCDERRKHFRRQLRRMRTTSAARTTTSTTTAARRKEEEEEGQAGGAGTPGRVDRIFLPHTCADAATSLDARLGTQCCPRGRVKVCR